jgi:hypothetical protein
VVETGTAELCQNGKKVQLKDHSIFVAFSKENP